MRLLYTMLCYALLPLVFLMLLWRSREVPSYRHRWSERLAWFPARAGEQPILVHAASVGEALAAVPLVRALQARYPNVPLLITTTTPTGSERVRAIFGGEVHHVYAPYDVPSVVFRFLNRTRPRFVIVMETELWPNLFHGLHARSIPLLIANARLSERSVRGYRRLGKLVRSTIDCIDVIAAQSPADADRYASIGAQGKQLVVTGNIKFDMSLDDDLLQSGMALRQQLGGERPVWIAASTHEGEDEQILAAHRQLLAEFPTLLLILVPRHPERFERVARLCQEQGVAVARRSLKDAGADAQVYLGDTMGELLLLYAAADVAFVGGSLVATGGHNLLEPAALGLVPVSGPHLFNFQQVADLLSTAQALELVHGPDQLATCVARLLRDESWRQQAGQRAQQVVEGNQGALARTLELISTSLSATEFRK